MRIPYSTEADWSPISQTSSIWMPQLPQGEFPPSLISVITPYFNAAEYFPGTLLSLKRQSFQNFEWLIIDDCSDDQETEQQFKQAQVIVPQIRILSTIRRTGPAAARNIGIAEARSPFLFFLDADDLIAPTTLEKCLWFLNTHDTVAFVSGYEVGFDAHSYLNTSGFEGREKFRDENQKNPMALLRRELLQEVGGFDISIRGGLEDWDLWLKLADRGYWGATIPEFFNWYRWKPGQRERWDNWNSIERIIQFRDMLEMRYPTAYSRAFGWSNRAFSKVALTNAVQANPNHLVVTNPLTVDDIPEVNSLTVIFISEPQEELERAAYERTSDVFCLGRFLPESEYQAFLDYLSNTRGGR